MKNIKTFEDFLNESAALNSKEIIGTPFKVAHLEVAEKDIPGSYGKLDLEDTVSALARLGTGWRLPTLEEFAMLVKDMETLGLVFRGNYWSGTSNQFGSLWYTSAAPGAPGYFDKGYDGRGNSRNYLSGAYMVRAVKGKIIGDTFKNWGGFPAIDRQPLYTLK